MTLQGDLTNGHPGLNGEPHDGATGNAIQHSRIERRRQEFTALHEEQVIARALGDVPLVVQHDGLGRAGVGRLDLGHDVVEVIERLDSRAQSGRMVPDRAGRDDLHPLLVQLGGIERDRVGNHDHLRVARLADVEPQRAGPASDDQADITVLDAIGGDSLFNGRSHLGRGNRDCQADGESAFVQPFDVLTQEEHFAAVDADAFEDAVAVEKAVIKNADDSLFLRDEGPVDVHLHGGLNQLEI